MLEEFEDTYSISFECFVEITGKTILSWAFVLGGDFGYFLNFLTSNGSTQVFSFSTIQSRKAV